MANKVDNFKGRQLFLLARWAETPEYSPLTPTPDLRGVEADYEAHEIEEVSEADETDSAEDDEGEEPLALLPYKAVLGGSVARGGIKVDFDEIDEEGIWQREEEIRQREEELKQREKAQRESRNRAIAGRLQEWFCENFEPPAPDSTYDQYIWGGPYEARSVITTLFPRYAEEEDEGIEIAVEELERRSAGWVPVDSRVEPKVKADEPKSADEAYARKQDSVRLLKELLNLIPEQPPGIGHNYPPEPIDDAPLDAADQIELRAAIEILEAQPLEPRDRGQEAKEVATVIESKGHKVRSWLARQGDTFVTEAVKEAGKEFGKWMPRAFWLLVIDRMFSVSEIVIHWLKLVFSTN